MFVVVHKVNRKDPPDKRPGAYGTLPQPVMDAVIPHDKKYNDAANSGLQFSKGEHQVILVRDLPSAQFIKAKFGAVAIGEVTDIMDVMTFVRAINVLLNNDIAIADVWPCIQFKVTYDVARALESNTKSIVLYPAFDATTMTVSGYEDMCKKAQEDAQKKEKDLKIEAAMLAIYGRREI